MAIFTALTVGMRYRIKRFDVTEEFICRVLRQGNVIPWTLVEDGLPEDAKILDVFRSEQGRKLMVIVASDSFPYFEMGHANWSEIPEIQVVLNTLPKTLGVDGMFDASMFEDDEPDAEFQEGARRIRFAGG